MTDTNDIPVEGQETQAQAERRGRGPTRPAILAADLIDDAIASKVKLALIIDTLDSTTTAKEIRTEIRQRRETLRDTVRRVEAEMATNEKLATLVECAERLPPAMRSFVVAALRGEMDAAPAEAQAE